MIDLYFFSLGLIIAALSIALVELVRWWQR